MIRYPKQFLLFYFLCVMMASCNEAGFGKKQFEFYYYPSKNVYYDVVNSKYTYSVDGGKTWNSFKPHTNAEPATLGNKQIIYSDDEQPWNLNEIHKKRYDATLISIADADTTAQQQDVVTNKKITVKKPALNVNAPVKEEKKESFLRRLFGGRKKNNNNQQQQ